MAVRSVFRVAIPVLTEADSPREFVRGAWRHRDMIGYTSVGAGTCLVDVRLNCRPEVTLHRLRRLKPMEPADDRAGLVWLLADADFIENTGKQNPEQHERQHHKDNIAPGEAQDCSSETAMAGAPLEFDRDRRLGREHRDPIAA